MPPEGGGWRRPREGSACWVIGVCGWRWRKASKRGSGAGPHAGVEGLPLPVGLREKLG